MDPLFSIVITTYNRQSLLDEAIASVLAQTVEDFECIVVDDASPVPATGPDDDRVRVVRRPTNGGEPAARNTGLDEARGRYVAFLDDDDLFVPERLAMGLEGMGRAPVSVCFRRGSDGSAGDDRILEGNVYHSILDGMTPQLGQVTVARDVAPRFDERFAGSVDIEWWLRVACDAIVSTVPRVGVKTDRLHDGPRNLNGDGGACTVPADVPRPVRGLFQAHPRAAAFRWKRIGLMAQAWRESGGTGRVRVAALAARAPHGGASGPLVPPMFETINVG